MMQLAFYKGRTRLFDRLVQWWTRGPYSHCELVIGGVCFSSSLRDGGVRAMPTIDLASGRWDVVDLPQYDAGAEQDALQWFMVHGGEQYDVLGLLGFVLPWRTENRKRWFCSEACAEALVMPFSWTISPNELAARIKAHPAVGGGAEFSVPGVSMAEPLITTEATLMKLLPGVVGSFISLGFIQRSWPERLVMAVGGAALSFWGTEWATAFLGMQKAEGLVGFLIGLFGMAMVAKVYEAIAAIDAPAVSRELRKRFFGGSP